MSELIIPLSNGNTLRCGPGLFHEWGGHVRICDPQGKEIAYWDNSEWGEDPESTMGAIFACATNDKNKQTEYMKSKQRREQ